MVSERNGGALKSRPAFDVRRRSLTGQAMRSDMLVSILYGVKVLMEGYGAGIRRRTLQV